MTPQVDKIISIFREISQIPRCSKHETQISQWLVDWAQNHQLAVKTDAVQNVLIQVPASPGYEDRPTVVLQGHMDMVCEKTPDSTHNFATDPIEFVFEGEWLHANKTTLGADNGIAIAIALAMVEDPDVKHPPLELLFTVDEETGLTGANALQPDFLQGKILINIDSEDEGVFTVGCAGGRDTKIHMDLEQESLPSDFQLFSLSIGGLKGGHSGVDIAKPRGNANQLLGRALHMLHCHTPLRLIQFQGGTAHNAIARDAQALFAINPTTFAKFDTLIPDYENLLKRELGLAEPKLQLTLAPCSQSFTQGLSQAASEKVMNLIEAMPHGVAGMSQAIHGLVETSNNFAKLQLQSGKLDLLTSQRSSVMSRLDEITHRIEAVAQLAEAEVKSGNGYPAWQPNMDSPLLKQCAQIYEQLFEVQPKIEVIHAGLECGVIGAKISGMDMISIGPTIQNPHSPDERLHLPSVEKIWDFLVGLLK